MAKAETAIKDRAGATPPTETATRDRASSAAAAAPARMVLAMNTSMAGNNFSYVPGDTVSVPKAVGDRWLETGTARKTKAGTEAMYDYEPGKPAPKPAKGKKAEPAPDPEESDEE